ncbi:MAG: hydroxymethylbilane synthase [Maricaulaceae bacterium]
MRAEPLQRSHDEIKPIIIGTRGSPLALWQARHVQSLLIEKHGFADDVVQIEIFKTSGDKLKGSLAEFGGKGLFTKELEEALLDGRIDIAVHSMKDVPTVSQKGLEIVSVLKREDPRDGFISHKCDDLMDLPKGAVIGTASLRRRAQLARLRPDVTFTLLRGNVGTRLEKLARGDCDATFLAVAGLNRLGQADVITQNVPTEMMLSAPAQGAIGIEMASENSRIYDLIKALDHMPTRHAITAERAFLAALDGSCRTPIAALGTITEGHMHFRGELLSHDGQTSFSRDVKIPLTPEMDIYKAAFEIGQEVRQEAQGQITWDEV